MGDTRSTVDTVHDAISLRDAFPRRSGTVRVRHAREDAVKYSRPVWVLMGECARDLPDRFRYGHVHRWFEAHYPDINERTLRVHLIGLTEGPSNPNPYLAKKPPLFRRIEHGEYEVIGRGATDHSKASRSAVVAPPILRRDGDGNAHVLLVGFEEEQRTTPAPARDLYLAPEFESIRGSVTDEELGWFVLSSEYGLLRPDSVVSPYVKRLRAEAAPFRRTWARWVVAKLAAEIDSLDGATVELACAEQFVEPLVELLESAGARVTVHPVAAV